MSRRIPRISIDQRADGTYRVRWRQDGRQRQEGGYPTETAAEAARFQIEARFRAGLPGTLDAYPIRQLIATWWDEYVLTLGNATIANYATAARRILDHLGNADARRQSVPLLIAFRDELDAELGNARLVNDCLKCLSSAYQRGVEAGTVEENPVRLVPRLAEPPTNVIVPTRIEAARIAITCPSDEQRSRLLVAALAGPRPGEQLGLQWRHFTESGLIIERSVDLRGQIGPTKTKQTRVVPLPPSVTHALDAWHRETKYPRLADPIWPSATGAILDPSNWRRDTWHPWRAEAECEHLHWKVWRHYFAATFAANGGTLMACSRVMGHGSIKTTADRYGYLFDEDVLVVMERIG